MTLRSGHGYGRERDLAAPLQELHERRLARHTDLLEDQPPPARGRRPATAAAPARRFRAALGVAERDRGVLTVYQY